MGIDAIVATVGFGRAATLRHHTAGTPDRRHTGPQAYRTAGIPGDAQVAFRVSRAPRGKSSTMAKDEQGTVFVLFGATGDLAKRMVLPAFYTLAIEDLLPKDWILVGNGRGDVSHEDFRAHVHDVLTEFGPAPDTGPWEQFSERLRFAGGGFNSDDPGSLLDVISDARAKAGAGAQLVHYLAVPPAAFPEVTKALGAHDLAENAR